MTGSYYDVLRLEWLRLFEGLLLDGQQVMAYDYSALDGAVLPYVILGDIVSNDRDNKNKDVENVTITLYIVNSYRGQGGRRVIDDIGDLIMGVKDQLNGADIGGYKIHEVRKVNDLTRFQQSTTAKVYRRIITFSHIIEQLNNE